MGVFYYLCVMDNEQLGFKKIIILHTFRRSCSFFYSVLCLTLFCAEKAAKAPFCTPDQVQQDQTERRKTDRPTPSIVLRQHIATLPIRRRRLHDVYSVCNGRGGVDIRHRTLLERDPAKQNSATLTDQQLLSQDGRQATPTAWGAQARAKSW